MFICTLPFKHRVGAGRVRALQPVRQLSGTRDPWRHGNWHPKPRDLTSLRPAGILGALHRNHTQADGEGLGCLSLAYLVWRMRLSVEYRRRL